MSTASLSPAELADVLEQFLDGTGGEWDWDQLENVPLSDPELERIRQDYILGTGKQRSPPYGPSQYGSPEAQAYLRGVIKMLRDLHDKRRESA